jgi:hypothetical protein
MTLVPAGFAAMVNRCESCHGILCNDDALADLQRQWFLWPKHDPREIDPGTAREGRRWNEMTDVPCPSCGVPMATIQAPEQQHIRLDRCLACRATFFDAGEMTDLRFDTLADSMRGLLLRWRGG